MKRSLTILPVLVLLLVSCKSDLTILDPQFSDQDSQLKDTRPLPASVLTRLNGVYNVVKGSGPFGDQVVLHYNGSDVSMFSAKNVSYMIMKTGMASDSSCILEGYWRYAQASNTGLVRFVIPTKQAKALFDTGTVPSSTTISGFYGDNNVTPESPVEFKYLRPLNRDADSFLIVGHRGGGRNSDGLPFSENSVEIIKFAGKLGANGVEIDIRLTKDGVPVLYHDEALNTRLIRGEYMIGPIGNYTFRQLRTYARLLNGELIPTLDEVLDTIVSSTNLRFVWLDVKDPAETDTLISLQQKYLAKAKQLGRELVIVFGLPDDGVYSAFSKHPLHLNTPSVCELTTDQARAVNAAFWAPRWTLGTQPTETALMHGEGRKALVWTLDQPEFINKYLREGTFDGFLTNYPTLVAYYHFIKE